MRQDGNKFYDRKHKITGEESVDGSQINCLKIPCITLDHYILQHAYEDAISLNNNNKTFWSNEYFILNDTCSMHYKGQQGN